ncbi:MAG: GldG family protein [Planctomycetes bacterium]|nr:GldG family protein [Planctomycetota bacterium]
MNTEPSGATRAPTVAVERSTGRGTRVAIGAQVAVTIVLALAAVLLVDWLSERPGLRVRADWTRDGANTLSPASLEVLERLPVDVKVDVFFQGRALERGLEMIGLEAQEHARKVLRLLQEASGGRIESEEHDLSDRRGNESPALARLAELELREVAPGGLVVVSSGKRSQVLQLRGDLCDLDPGYPGDQTTPPIPPRVAALRAEEAFVGALHKVAASDEPKVLFTIGHGELDPKSADVGGLAQLVLALEADGFRVASYDIQKQGPIPEECQLLVVLGPEQPFTETEAREVQNFLDTGGRLVAAPDFKTEHDGPLSLAGLLDGYGIRPRMHGLLARPFAQASGEALTGIPDCAQNVIVFGHGMAAQNPVTEPLRRAGRRVYLPFARALDRSTALAGGTVIQILTSEPEDWCDLGDPSDPSKHDWAPGAGELRGPFAVALQAVYPARRSPPAARGVPGGRAEGRILCVGSSAAFTNQLLPANRDFLLNAFNWASSREYRVSVGAKSPQARRIDVGQGNALQRIHLVAVFLLPGVMLALGLLTAWRRRR